MNETDTPSAFQRLKEIFIGGARNFYDPKVFHSLALTAFFAWVGLGADGLSSSSYGPEEAFLALQGHHYLGIFVAIASGITVFVISAGYSQVIDLFPAGGGGYLVASKLLTPELGMVSGCALLIDYVLTITISIASGADALFSFLPSYLLPYKLLIAVFGVVFLSILNMRGVKESVAPLVPIFMIFVLTHLFIIVYALVVNFANFGAIAHETVVETHAATQELGLWGVLFLILRAYSMGAGTFTGIEAVSNGLPILQEPRVKTAHRTMKYMSYSLAFTVIGLMLAYLLFKVDHQPGKTLNAVLFESATASWSPSWGYGFVTVTLISEAIILFVAAQAGFLGGPRVLSNMALDRWFPTKFAILSDRLVTANGVLMMGIAALVTMIATGGSVKFLVVLYSINVFITFVLSQAGMTRHWWQVRQSGESGWKRKIFVSGLGLALTGFILITVTVLKFFEGGWITILITGALVGIAFMVRRHYNYTFHLLKRLDSLVLGAVESRSSGEDAEAPIKNPPFDKSAKTAVLLVNGFNGLGLHTLFTIIRSFSGVFKNFIFVQVGVIDAGNFKGVEEVEHLENFISADVQKYVDYMRKHGFYADGFSKVGTDVVGEVLEIAPKILEKYPNAIFFGGQLVFPEDTFLSRWLHNYMVFTIQRRFYYKAIPFFILPVRI